MKPVRLISSILFLVFLLAMVSQPCLADIAPPEQPPGSNPLPEIEATQVRMAAETILFEVIAATPENSLGKAKVTASFTMVNTGVEDETLRVRFPLTSSAGVEYGSRKLEAFSAKVAGIQVTITEIISDYYGAYAGPWAQFPVTFPAGKSVEIEVTYLVEGEGEYPFIAFKYILATGAGWKDSIGSVDLILRLPYAANMQNVIFDTEIGWSTTTTEGEISGREVRWHFEDLEPDSSNNFSVSLVMPSVWRAVLREQDQLAKNAQDGEAWGRLGKLYKECYFLRRGFREDPGGQDLYNLSQQAYQNSTRLLPEDALWQAGFAELLWRHWYWSEAFQVPPDYEELTQALGLLQKSLAIDPKTEKAISLVDEIRYAVPEAVQVEGDQVIFALLTATPTFIPSQTSTLPPTATPEPTATLSAVILPATSVSSTTPTLMTPSPTVTPSSPPPAAAKPALPICGGALLTPAPYLFAQWKRKSKARELTKT